MTAELQDAIHAATAWARTRPNDVSAPAALLYLQAIPEAIAMYGEEGLKIQLLYILGNLQGWKGEEARATKAILRRYTK